MSSTDPTQEDAEKSARDAAEALIESLLEEFDCQPVLFVGAGISRRYMAAPSWDGMLRAILTKVGKSDDDLTYIWQKHESNLIAVGTAAADIVFEWAWSEGKGAFSEDLYAPDFPKSVFIKSMIASELIGLEASIQTIADKGVADELEAFRKIRPHAIITTNYDRLMESVLEGYEPIVGNSVLKYNLNAYGEIYHIHGSVDDPQSMVLVQKDYDGWQDNSKYFAAKLLTYFAEHPIFILGYALSDPNVKTVLADIGRYVADDTGLIGNVVQIVWQPNGATVEPETQFAIEADGAQFRIRVLNVSSLDFVFKALQARHELVNVNPALVRALAARVMQLTRRDIPNGNIEVDYKTLEQAAEGDNLPAMLGMTLATNVNMQHPHLLSAVGKKLGFAGWHDADKLIKKIKEEKGVDIKGSDNQYHCRVKTGNGQKSFSRKFSDDAVTLLAKVRDGEPYELHI